MLHQDQCSELIISYRESTKETALPRKLRTLYLYWVFWVFWVMKCKYPSFVFGFANLLLIYYISNQLYGKSTALVSTFLYSCTPILIHFESQARGYSIKVTFTLLLFIACFHFLQKPSKPYLFIISFTFVF